MNLYNAIMQSLEEDNSVTIKQEGKTGVRITVRNQRTDGITQSVKIIINDDINKANDPSILLSEAIEFCNKEVENGKE